MLMSVVGLLFFFIFLYSVAGTMLFMNVYHQKCYDADGKPEEAGDDEDMYGCGQWRTCPTGFTCQVGSIDCHMHACSFSKHPTHDIMDVVQVTLLLQPSHI